MKSTEGQKVENRLEFSNGKKYTVNVLCDTIPKDMRADTYLVQTEPMTDQSNDQIPSWWANGFYWGSLKENG